MKINTVKNKNTNFGSVSIRAARKYLASDYYMKNWETEKYKFLEFCKQQNKNVNYHVGYNHITDRYFACEALINTEPSSSYGTLRTSHFFPVPYETMEDYKLQNSYSNIYDAGRACDILEKHNPGSKGEYSRYLDYCI